MQRRDTNFYYSFLALPRAKRDAIVAVWDFCRAVDDAADEPGEGSARPGDALGIWRREVAALFEDAAPVTPQGLALAPFVGRFGLPRGPFEAVVDGVEMDLVQSSYATFGDLRTYCSRVASAVGLICLEIFGYRDPRAREFAVELGLALQLTNIIRDVKEDHERGRTYLPLEDLERFGVSPADLAAGPVTPAIRDLMAFQCARARRHYAAAAAALPRVDRRSLVAARIMGAVYLAILRRIERRGFDVFSGKVTLPRWRKALIALSVWAQTAVGF